jgi:hypothetical protein
MPYWIMALSTGFLKAHVEQWEEKLARDFLSYRTAWPGRLFHHTPIENAVRILRGGVLLSRVDSATTRVLDVAVPEIVNSRSDAHKFVRMYFRPRTPTQYRIEGIRKASEYYMGRHAPVLIMLVFDIRAVLSQPGVQFSNGNMQSHFTAVGDSERFFRFSIDWDSVFHSGSTTDSRIFARRCAEALIPSPHKIANSLQWVCCRSQAERAMLLHLIGQTWAAIWAKKIIVLDDINVFQKDYVYCEDVGIDEAGIVLRLHPRSDNANVTLRVGVWNSNHNQVMNAPFKDFRPVPANALRWRISHKFVPDAYRVQVELEDCIAYDATLLLDEMPF